MGMRQARETSRARRWGCPGLTEYRPESQTPTVGCIAKKLIEEPYALWIGRR